MNIISASRRTDIPAFFSEWFMNRIRAGNAEYLNPFSNQACSVSLAPDDVHSIVFWTKNFAPMMKYIDELDARRYKFSILYTVTGLPRIFEPYVPEPGHSVKVIKQLAERYSPLHVTWRFDPIVLSNVTPVDERLKTFEELAGSLSGSVKRCIVSFVDMYGKTVRNFKCLSDKEKIVFQETFDKMMILKKMSDIASRYDIQLYTCCESGIDANIVPASSCIDGKLLAEIFPDRPVIKRKNSTRDNCNCTVSRDIGAYATCLHGCVYCYANNSYEQAQANSKRHDKYSSLLLPRS